MTDIILKDKSLELDCKTTIVEIVDTDDGCCCIELYNKHDGAIYSAILTVKQAEWLSKYLQLKVNLKSW